MDACRTLEGYAHPVALERRGRMEQHLEYRAAAEAAVDQCIKDGYLVDYLTEHKAEVVNMLFTMQDEERAMRVHYKAIEKEAREKGIEEGRSIGIKKGIEQGIEQAAERLRAAGADEKLMRIALGK